MPYGNEDIITSRVAAQAAKTNTISGTVKIEGVTYTFSEREFPLGFSMVVPECFHTLAPEQARIKYPYEDRPVVIISSENTTVNLAFDSGGPAVESLGERMAMYSSLIKHMHPSYVFFGQNIYDLTDGNKVACFDYRSHAIDSDIYNLNFFTDFDSQELLGWFNCPIDLREKWEHLAKQMIKSIKSLPPDEQEE